MKCRLIKALWDFLAWTDTSPCSNFVVYCFLIPIIPPAKGRLSHFSYIGFQLMHCCFFRKIWRYCSLCSGQCTYVHRLPTCQYFDCKLRLLKPLEYILCWKLTFCLLRVLKFGQFLCDEFYHVTDIVTVLYYLFWILYPILLAEATGCKALV